MSRVVVAILLGSLVVPGALLAQDTEALDEAADILRESLKKSKAKGGVVIKGTIEREDPMGGMGIVVGGLGGSDIEGDFTVRIGKSVA